MQYFLAKNINLSKKGGADAKFQTYKAEKIAAKFSPAYWDLNEEKTTNQFNLFKSMTNLILGITKFCLKNERLKINYMSTFFDTDL